jgi:hypothetical protein
MTRVRLSFVANSTGCKLFMIYFGPCGPRRFRFYSNYLVEKFLNLKFNFLLAVLFNMAITNCINKISLHISFILSPQINSINFPLVRCFLFCLLDSFACQHSMLLG